MLALIKNKEIIFLIPFILITIVFSYYLSLNNYLIPHTTFELGVAIVSFTIFLIGLNTSNYSRNNFINTLAPGYLLVGILTVLHALTYKGVNVLAIADTDMPTQFWIASRYVESTTILVATFFINKSKETNIKRNSCIFLVVAIIITTLIIVKKFPDCFIEGEGLTQFKIISEYVISFIYSFSTFILWRQRKKFDTYHISTLLISMIFRVLAELSFTLYNDVYGIFNFIGHVFVFISIILTYLSLIKGTLTNPYKQLFNDLADTNEKLMIKDFAIESSVNAVVLTNLDDEITDVNLSFLKLFDIPSKEAVYGHKLEDYLYVNNIFELNKEIFKINGCWSGEVFAKKNDGSMIDVHLTLTYVLSQHKKPLRIMASLIDITDSKKNLSDLIKAKRDAEAASVAKSNFLANMSHEIRTPMNGILSYIYLLEKTRINPNQTKYINIIKNQTKTLLTVINDILDVSKIESGKFELESIPFDFRSNIENAFLLYKESANEKDIEVQLQIDERIPNTLIGDPVRIRQILNNLINNAIKFTNKGYVRLDIKLVSKSENVNLIQFLITDTGIGMSQETIEKLFKPFTQADVSSTRKFGGSGLGLSICKSYVELMGGNISVQSEENKGSTFMFTIYFEESLQVVEKEEIMKENDLLTVFKEDLKVLVVDDNLVNRELLVDLLQLNNIQCNTVTNGEEAVQAYLNQKYDIILMDCQMPVMNGYEATRKIREYEAKKEHIIIIALTASAMKGDIERCIAAGMDDYLSKPLDIKRLLSMINKYAQKEIKELDLNLLQDHNLSIKVC